MENWLLNNGYIFKNGTYINYDVGIMVELVKNDRPFVQSLHGFYTEEYVKLSLTIAENYPMIL